MRTETTVGMEGFVDGEGSPAGEEEKKEGENGSLKIRFRIGQRVRFSGGMDIEFHRRYRDEPLFFSFFLLCFLTNLRFCKIMIHSGKKYTLTLNFLLIYP